MLTLRTGRSANEIPLQDQAHHETEVPLNTEHGKSSDRRSEASDWKEQITIKLTRAEEQIEPSEFRLEAPRRSPAQKPLVEAPRGSPTQKPLVEALRGSPAQKPHAEAPRGSPARKPRTEAPRGLCCLLQIFHTSSV